MSESGRTVPLLGESGGQHILTALVDHEETYGPRVIEKFVRSLPSVATAVDLGAGQGRDLQIIRGIHRNAKTVAVEGSRENAARLAGAADEVHLMDIERAVLPFANESVDLFVANQVLEHTKEIFWIFHEVTRSLRVGGHFLIGVPNVASLHNRALLLLGVHPTQHKLCSAHVRPFSKGDTMRFVDACFPGGYSLARFAGSQFYPFPAAVARLLSAVFPTAAFSIFFLLRKVRRYEGEFASYPIRARLETNFWTGGADHAPGADHVVEA